MSKSKQKTLNKKRSDEEARKEASLQRSLEDECRIGLMDYFNQVLTVSETQRLMEDNHKIEVKSLWEDRWRINVWTKTQPEGSFMFTYHIKFSAFIIWSEEFGVTRCNPDIKHAARSNFSCKEDMFK